ncbi:DUF6321 domain-containing protein [bacterium]|nr:DUF6321 domain-containing protein [bacterium]
MAYVQNNNPFPVTSCGRRRTFTQGGVPSDDRNKQSRFNDSPAKEKFEPHNMYDKQKAETKKEHLELKEKGYGHSPVKKSCNCWEGYSRVPGTKPCAPGSCKKSSPAKQSNKKTKGKDRHFRTPEEGAGMTAKGVASYKSQNPGSKLKTAVTGKVKPGSKDAGRRKSFCARSKGWTGERGKAARARWKC